MVFYIEIQMLYNMWNASIWSCILSLENIGQKESLCRRFGIVFWGFRDNGKSRVEMLNYDILLLIKKYLEKYRIYSLRKTEWKQFGIFFSHILVSMAYIWNIHFHSIL